MNRRTFLKIAGMGSIAFAAGCSADPEKTLYSLVQAPDDMVTGQPQWYAATCRECPAGCGILAKNREGRVIKVEGNPLHPVNRGKLCIRGQAALQGIYDPDRITAPMLREGEVWRPIGWGEAAGLLRDRGSAAARRGGGRVRMLTEVVGTPFAQLATEALAAWNAPAPLAFETFGYESLKTANHLAFGVEGLVGYRLEQADLLLGFGADFLDTWLSPVEFARRFKRMHAFNGREKGLFIHVAPFQSVTAANADRWVGCRPGSEAVVALGLLQVALDVGRADHLPTDLRAALEHALTPFHRERVLAQADIPSETYDRVIQRLFNARRPLVLPTSAAPAGGNGLAANLAANLLNRVLDPTLAGLDFGCRYRVESAARRQEVQGLVDEVRGGEVDLLLVNNTNPCYALPPGSGVAEALARPGVFVVSFSNVMDDTTARSHMVLPVRLPLESWDLYDGVQGQPGVLQPAMGRLTEAPLLGDVLLETAFAQGRPAEGYKAYLARWLARRGAVATDADWVTLFQQGGLFTPPAEVPPPAFSPDPAAVAAVVAAVVDPAPGPIWLAAPSIRYFDGRGANRAWLQEVPDPLTAVAWQNPILLHPETAADFGLQPGDRVRVEGAGARLEAPLYIWEGVQPDALVMAAGLGHEAYGRYAAGRGANPLALLAPETDPADGGPLWGLRQPVLTRIGEGVVAHADGSRLQHGRKIAVSVPLEDLAGTHAAAPHAAGLTMESFPLTLPLPEGYDPQRDFYPAHDHEGYRWSLVVDLDRCIGCGACAGACYAENNLGVVGERRMIEGREMAWLQVQRYLDPDRPERVLFLPMMCQHCDNAPCESVCPVYAPHHDKEGLNNQIYNRCIGTRFCVQNCPYKVRRFNWFTWQWPDPLPLQLNPDVTVRAKGVMEKCSFCVQRIKAGHNAAKNAKRPIRDGEVTPACAQTCPTEALVFGNLMDPASRVRRMVDDPRAYQVMGYLNTKPAVIYLKKVVQEV
jgi:molybdopterin-containing oxidoreductase family iron-sulfur binding subunit